MTMENDELKEAERVAANAALESVAHAREARADAADAEREKAEAEGAAETAKAVAVVATVQAAEIAAELGQEQAALANIQAAKTVAENSEKMVWLEGQVKALELTVQSTQSELASMRQMMTDLQSQVLTLTTPPPPPPELATPPLVELTDPASVPEAVQKAQEAPAPKRRTWL